MGHLVLPRVLPGLWRILRAATRRQYHQGTAKFVRSGQSKLYLHDAICWYRTLFTGLGCSDCHHASAALRGRLAPGSPCVPADKSAVTQIWRILYLMKANALTCIYRDESHVNLYTGLYYCQGRAALPLPCGTRNRFARRMVLKRNKRLPALASKNCSLLPFCQNPGLPQGIDHRLLSRTASWLSPNALGRVMPCSKN